MKGLFIDIEGLDGCGKTTLVNEIKRQLELDGFHVVLTREPGGTETAEKIRDILLHAEEPIPAAAEAMLFAASRTIHTENKIKPALENGYIVISDRYLDSSIAYQGMGRDLGPFNVAQLNDFGIKGFRPDLVLYLDIDPVEGRKRINREMDRMEKEDIEFYNKIREAFCTLCRYRIDASMSKNEVAQQAMKIIYEKLNEKE